MIKNRQSDADWPAFVSQRQQAGAFDAQGRLVKTTVTGSGTTWNLGQFTYDAANNLTCSAARVNPATFGAPPASACTLASNTAPLDQITANTYDAANQKIVVTNGYATTAHGNYAAIAYTPNGLTQTITDANANQTRMIYDGFDRVTQVQYPLPTLGSGAPNPGDYESVTYQADGNILTRRRRSGETIEVAWRIRTGR